jgi:hypothetical protein
MRAFKSALAWGMGLLGHIGQHCKWPPTVKSEVASRVSEITKVPLEFATKRRMQMSPTSWAAECSAHVTWAKGLIETMHPAVTTEDWSLMDCQEYFVDLEMSLAGVATALEVSAPGQLRDDQMGVYRELEMEVGVARGLANKLRARHLEAYDLQGRPVAIADSSEITEKLRAARLRLDAKLSANLGADHADQVARSLQQRLSKGECTGKPSAPPPSPPEGRGSSEGAWPWFSGHMEDLPWFRQAWETHAKRFHHGLAPEVLVGGLWKYCMTCAAGRVIESAHDPTEAWRLLESHFGRQTAIIDELISQLLSAERVVIDAQILAHYSRILMAIREAKELGRLQDLLTANRIEALLKILPKKEGNYWRQEQEGVVAKDLPVAFYVFAKGRALELGSNAAAFRTAQDTVVAQDLVWEGPCVLGDLCGGSHAPEGCRLFGDLAPEDRLVVIRRKQLCYLCFQHSDNQPCKSQSLPACSIGGCMRMHSKLLHEALQKEETRAIVIEVEEDPEEPEENEEFYAANFESWGQEDEDEEEEEEGMEPDEELPPLIDPKEDRPRLCQQRVPLEVNGNLTSLHTLYDWESSNTLVRKESARRIGLQAVRAPRRAIKGYQGEGLITDSVYYLPLLDADGNILVVRAHGVDEITTVTRTRLPHGAREIFPAIRAYMPWMETGAGRVELLIGLDNKQWLPAHMENSWDPDDDMRLIKSAFGYCIMITDGWGRDLFPPKDPQDESEGAAGGNAKVPEGTAGVRLEEYRGWSRGTWSGEGANAQEAPGDGNRGTCNGSQGGTAARRASASRRRSNP